MSQLVSRVWQVLAGKPALAAVLLGFLSATGFQPLGLWPLALVAMALFVALLAEATGPWRAAWLGWLFGWAHFTFGNNWIATAFTHQAAMPAAYGWGAVPLLAIYLAVYPALAAAGAYLLAGRRSATPGWPLALAFAGCWTIAEWLRAWVFTGYAWNPFALVLLGPFDRPGLAMLAPWMGTYALSGVAVLLAGAGAALASRGKWLGFAALAAVIGAGSFLPGGRSEASALAFTVVQPDLRQAVLNEPRLYEANFLKLAALSRPLKPGQERIVLWPESGLVDYLQPGYPQRYYDAVTAFGDPLLSRERLGRTIGPGSVLLTGAENLRLEGEGDTARATGAYNSITALDSEGKILGSYVKAHLVPYGEYLPMRSLLTPLGFDRLVPGSIDFLPGPGPATLDLGSHGRAAMQICYEIVFAGQVVDRFGGDSARPDYLFNPSNDGWFGRFGPPQHLAQARLRAIEEGLPVLRATTTGVSALIDPYGRVVRHLPWQTAGRIDGFVPKALPPTPFARLGNGLSLLWAMVFLVLAAVAMRRRPR